MAQAGESRSPRSPISPDGKAPRGRDAMVQLVMALDEDSGCPGERLIRTTSALLKTHLEKWEKERGSACRPEDCAMTPLEFFCHVQAKNAASEISVRITEMNLTYLHIRELLQNLFALVTFIRPKSVESAHFFCNNYIQVLVPIVQDIENKLAQFDKAPPIDWDAAVKRLNSYERQYHTAIETAVACTRTTSGVKRRDPNRESDDIPFNYYVPLLNDFDVGKILGRGSFGAVYEAKYRDEVQCAIKVSIAPVLQGDEGGQKRELSLIDKVVASVVSNHPFVVRFLACFVAGVPATSEAQARFPDTHLRAYLTVMELVQGVDLSVFATRFRLCGRELAIHIIAQLAMAVEHFHFCGLIHRDIKLSNIMILHNARVKLIDFDVSKICIAHFSRIYSLSYFRRTYAEFRVSEKIGTAAYMAPELHLGQRFGRAIDWWSLGVVGYRLFLGRLPFRGTTEKMVDQITNQNLNWSSNTSKVPGMKDSKARCIKEFLASILHKSPLHRLGSRSYDDIFGHEVFLGLEWEKLSRKNFDCPPLKELVGQESSGGNRVYEENPVMDGARMKQGRRLKPPAFQELEDIPNVQHVKLYTFISATIKNLVSKKGGTSDFLDEPPSVRHITKLCRRSIGEDSLSGEVGQTCELARTNPDTVKFVCDMHRKRFCPYQRTPVLFEQMPGYDGQQKLVVRKVNHPALISTLYEGDVIARIAGADSALWDSHSAESLFSIQSCVPIEVIADNAFRFATTSSLAVDDLQTRYGIISVDFVQAGKIACPVFGSMTKWPYGFECRALKYWNLKTMATSRVIVVGRFDLHKQQTAEASSKLFFGDVILSVNEVVEVDACLRVLRGNRELKNVKAVPCSPLRNPLINTITPPDYRERS